MVKAYKMRVQGTVGLVGCWLGAAGGDGEPQDSPMAPGNLPQALPRRSCATQARPARPHPFCSSAHGWHPEL